MRICDLREKEVINICDGERLGFVEDVEFDFVHRKNYTYYYSGPLQIFWCAG